MKKIAVLTSGGDAPGMNAAVRAVVREGISLGIEVYGVQRGFDGLLAGQISIMEWSSVADIIQKGGTILKTARSDSFRTKEGCKLGADILKTFGIEGIVIIGGDGSFRGGAALSEHDITVVGIPGTIDNDLGYTDYTIGFDTAINTVLALISNIRDTSSAHERTTIIEVMGRDCGDIALYAGLAGGAEVILVPEHKTDINEVCRTILQSKYSGKLHSVIIKSEGTEMSIDQLADSIEAKTNQRVRKVVLSYVQRGGTPTLRDRYLGSLMGSKAAQLLYNDTNSVAIGIRNDIITVDDLKKAAEVKREFNLDLLKLAIRIS